MVTHDLRSPLTALFGSLKLIAAGAKGPVSPVVETEVNIAANNVSKLCMFVND
jgi:K+-sensing histidine kinase KdpD